MTESISNSIKSKKILSEVIKTNNLVINDKLFIGYNSNDTNTLKTLSNDNDSNLFVRTNAKIDNKLYIGNNNSLHNASLNVGGNAILKGPVNIGFENNIPASSSTLNINGNTEIYSDNIVYGSNFIKNNLFVNNKATFNNDIYLSNSLSLDDETIVMNINNNTLSSKDCKILLDNILNKLVKYDVKNNSSLKFYSKNSNLFSSVLSVSKNFIISNNTYYSYLLVHAIFSKNTIITVKPIIDTFILLNSNEEIVRINETISSNKSSELTSMDISCNDNSDIDFFLNN